MEPKAGGYGYTRKSFVQAASLGKNGFIAAFADAPAAGHQSAVARRSRDQSSRYSDLSLDEEDLIKEDNHVHVACII